MLPAPLHLPKAPDPNRLDRLGKILARDLHRLNSMPLLDLLHAHRGQSNINPEVRHLHHPARHLLHHLGTHGAPVVLTTPPWTSAQKDAAVTRGPHRLAHEYVTFLRDELADMVDRATWMVLPYHRVRELRNLRISPMAWFRSMNGAP